MVIETMGEIDVATSDTIKNIKWLTFSTIVGDIGKTTCVINYLAIS